MGDNAHGATPLLEASELGEHVLEGLRVQGAEPLVNKQGVQAHAPGLRRDDVGQGQGQGERDVEGLPARERPGIPAAPDPEVVGDGQAQALAAPALPRLLVDPDQLVASRGHLRQALVGEHQDLIEPGLEHPGGQGGARRVVAPGQGGHLQQGRAGADGGLVGAGGLLHLGAGLVQLGVRGLGARPGLSGPFRGGLRLVQGQGRGPQVVLLPVQALQLRGLQPRPDAPPGGVGLPDGLLQGLSVVVVHPRRLSLPDVGEALPPQGLGQLGTGAASPLQGRAGLGHLPAGRLRLQRPGQQRGAPGGHARPGPAPLLTACDVLLQGLPVRLQAGEGRLTVQAGGVHGLVLLGGGGVEGLELGRQVLRLLGRLTGGVHGGVGLLPGPGGLRDLHAVGVVARPGQALGDGLKLPAGGGERPVGLALEGLGLLHLRPAGARGVPGGGEGVLPGAAHRAGLAAPQLTGQGPGGGGDPPQAGVQDVLGRLLGRLHGPGALLAAALLLVRQLLDAERRPVPLVGPGAAVLQALTLTAQAGLLQAPGQVGPLGGALVEVRQTSRYQPLGVRQLLAAPVQRPGALRQSRLQLHEALQLAVLTTAAVRQGVELCGTGAGCASRCGAGRAGRCGAGRAGRCGAGRASRCDLPGPRARGTVGQGGRGVVARTRPGQVLQHPPGPVVHGPDQGAHGLTDTVLRPVGCLLGPAGPGPFKFVWPGLFGPAGPGSLKFVWLDPLGPAGLGSLGSVWSGSLGPSAGGCGYTGQRRHGLLGPGPGGALGPHQGPDALGPLRGPQSLGVLGVLVGPLLQAPPLLHQGPTPFQTVVDLARPLVVLPGPLQGVGGLERQGLAALQGLLGLLAGPGSGAAERLQVGDGVLQGGHELGVQAPGPLAVHLLALRPLVGQARVPDQDAHLGAQIRRGLVHLPGLGPGGLDEAVLDGVVYPGAKHVPEQALALGGLGPQEAGELPLRQDHRLGELLPAQAHHAGDLRVGLPHPGHRLVQRLPAHPGQVPQPDRGVLGGGALTAPLGPLVGGGAAHPVHPRAGGEHQLDGSGILRPGQGGADALPGGVRRVRHLPVQGEDDGVDNRGLARPGGPGEQEPARGAHGVEVNALLAGIGADAGHGQVVDPHLSLRCAARADS